MKIQWNTIKILEISAKSEYDQEDWLILYIIIYGTAYGAFSPLRASVMADHFGRRAYGSITAMQGVPVALCGGLGH